MPRTKNLFLDLQTRSTGGQCGDQQRSFSEDQEEVIVEKEKAEKKVVGWFFLSFLLSLHINEFTIG